MNSKIVFEDLKIYAYHGVLPEETKIGAYYILQLEIQTNLWKASESDDLQDTINYAEINRIIHQEMAIPSQLLERVAGRIIIKIKEEFPEIKAIKIKISKTNPPMQGEMKGVAVVLEKDW